MNKVQYILIFYYHDTYVDKYDNIGLLRLALANLKEIYKNDNDFRYEIYCAKNVTEEINNLESKGE